MPLPSGSSGAKTRLVRAVLACTVAISLLIPAIAYGQESSGLRIVPLVRDDMVLVSFQLADGFTDEIRAAIRSGLKTTFTYTVDLRLDVPGWVDRTIKSATVQSIVEFDNLERRFTVVKSIDGRTAETTQTEDEALVRQWMTSMSRLALFRTNLLEPNRDYYIRVGATARPSNGSLLWPFGTGTSAQAKFTFIR